MALKTDRADPQVRALLDEMAGQPPLTELTVAEARVRPAVFAAAPRAVGSVVQRGFPGPAGVLPVRIYRPATPRPHAALVYFHGGGWVVGSLDAADALCRDISALASCAVVSVDYRLAPETKFPGAVDDAYAAVSWVARAADELGIDRKRVAVGGSSAGGNLAAVAALMARERGTPAIAFQLLIVPVTDLRFATGSHEEFAEGYGLTRADMRWYAERYVRTPLDAEDPHASVLRAPDLHNLPPALVITAECDPLRDEGEAFAARLRESGVKVEAQRYPGMFHGFLGFPTRLDQARRAIDDIALGLKEALASR